MKLQKGKILWVDDEIDHLKSHIVFLEERGYSVTPVANAQEAIGADIEEYLTKPVNPSQIFSSCKRILEKKRISRDRLTREYTSEFTEISDLLDGEIPPG